MAEFLGLAPSRSCSPTAPTRPSTCSAGPTWSPATGLWSSRRALPCTNTRRACCGAEVVMFRRVRGFAFPLEGLLASVTPRDTPDRHRQPQQPHRRTCRSVDLLTSRGGAAGGRCSSTRPTSSCLRLAGWRDRPPAQPLRHAHLLQGLWPCRPAHRGAAGRRTARRGSHSLPPTTSTRSPWPACRRRSPMRPTCGAASPRCAADAACWRRCASTASARGAARPTSCSPTSALTPLPSSRRWRGAACSCATARATRPVPAACASRSAQRSSLRALEAIDESIQEIGMCRGSSA